MSLGLKFYRKYSMNGLQRGRADRLTSFYQIGYTISDAVRMLLTRIAAEKAMPFEVRVPNRESLAAMEAGERGEVTRAARVAAMMAALNADD